MNNYRWTCQNCEGPNSKELDECASCGCPAVISAHDLKEWKSGEIHIPKKPSLMGYNIWGALHWLYDKVAPCPNCALLMSVKYRECAHCGYKLNELQHQLQIMHDKNIKASGWKFGIIWFPALFFTLWAIFWVTHGS
jgi:hypothetical protein